MPQCRWPRLGFGSGLPVPTSGATAGCDAPPGSRLAWFLQHPRRMWQVVRNVRSAIGGRERPVEEAVRPTSGVPGQARLVFPDEFADEDTAPTPTLPGRVRGRTARLAAYGAAGLLAGAGLFRLGSVVASPPSRVSRGESGAAPRLSPQERVDRVADTLALATGAFDLRVRLFHRRQMQCPDLARGLVVVEERWAEYNAARAARGVAHDSAHSALDGSLYASVDAAERQFEQSSCPRP
jgi:hypothetical protein